MDELLEKFEKNDEGESGLEYVDEEDLLDFLNDNDSERDLGVCLGLTVSLELALRSFSD